MLFPLTVKFSSTNERRFRRTVGRLVLILAVGLTLSCAGTTAAQSSATKPPVTGSESQELGTATAEQVKLVTDALSGVKLSGNFTFHGKDEKSLVPEEYYILSAEKQSLGEFWVLTARIKYGTHDVTVPMAMEIKFAGDTPVITVDKLTIPGMGTFDARVLIRPDGYAGTWAHDQVGGHLFGTITKLSESELAELRTRVKRNRKDKSN